MAKLRDIAKGTRAVKPVRFRLANAAPEPPQAADDAEAGVSSLKVTVGVRVMTGAEQMEVFQRAGEDAKARGVAEWGEHNPICRLAQMARTLEIACVDVDNPDERFFSSADEILSSPLIGSDNIALLYEAQDHWQDECSFGHRKLTADQMIGYIIEEAERPESAESPFSRMRPGSLLSCMRFMAQLWWTSLKASSPTFSPSDTDTTSSPKNESDDVLATEE